MPTVIVSTSNPGASAEEIETEITKRIEDAVNTTSGIDTLVFNSTHAGGGVPEDGYVLLGDSKRIDLSRVLAAGEINRVVVQHLDDCAGQAWLGTVQLEVKGDPGATAARPTWGRLKAMYH